MGAFANTEALTILASSATTNRLRGLLMSEASEGFVHSVDRTP